MISRSPLVSDTFSGHVRSDKMLNHRICVTLGLCVDALLCLSLFIIGNVLSPLVPLSNIINDAEHADFLLNTFFAEGLLHLSVKATLNSEDTVLKHSICDVQYVKLIYVTYFYDF